MVPRTDIPPHGHYRVSQTSPSERWTKSDLRGTGYWAPSPNPNPNPDPKWNFTVVGAGALIQRPNITLVADGAPPQAREAPAPTLAEDEDEDTQFASAVMLGITHREYLHVLRHFLRNNMVALFLPVQKNGTKTSC